MPQQSGSQEPLWHMPPVVPIRQLVDSIETLVPNLASILGWRAHAPDWVHTQQQLAACNKRFNLNLTHLRTLSYALESAAELYRKDNKKWIVQYDCICSEVLWSLNEIGQISQLVSTVLQGSTGNLTSVDKTAMPAWISDSMTPVQDAVNALPQLLLAVQELAKQLRVQTSSHAGGRTPDDAEATGEGADDHQDTVAETWNTKLQPAVQNVLQLLITWGDFFMKQNNLPYVVRGFDWKAGCIFFAEAGAGMLIRSQALSPLIEKLNAAMANATANATPNAQMQQLDLLLDLQGQIGECEASLYSALQCFRVMKEVQFVNWNEEVAAVEQQIQCSLDLRLNSVGRLQEIVSTLNDQRNTSPFVVTYDKQPQPAGGEGADGDDSMVMHFKGLHFSKDLHSVGPMRHSILLKHQVGNNMFSSAVHEAAKVQEWEQVERETDKETALFEADEAMQAKFLELSENVSDGVFRSVQYYINNLRGFQQQLSGVRSTSAIYKDLDLDVLATTKTPFVSTSVSADYVVKYGTGCFLLGSDATEKRVLPNYNAAGMPQFAALGKAWVLCSPSKMLQRMLLVSTAHEYNGYVIKRAHRKSQQHELVFLQHLPGKHIVHEEVLDVPKLDKWEEYMEVRWGLKRAVFEIWKKRILNPLLSVEEKSAKEKEFVDFLYSKNTVVTQFFRNFVVKVIHVMPLQIGHDSVPLCNPIEWLEWKLRKTKRSSAQPSAAATSATTEDGADEEQEAEQAPDEAEEEEPGASDSNGEPAAPVEDSEAPKAPEDAAAGENTEQETVVAEKSVQPEQPAVETNEKQKQEEAPATTTEDEKPDEETKEASEPEEEKHQEEEAEAVKDSKPDPPEVSAPVEEESVVEEAEPDKDEKKDVEAEAEGDPKLESGDDPKEEAAGDGEEAVLASLKPKPPGAK
eukprot:TRINITY_DN62117_c0_g1_i1.p1 TRINITY_DN62117_c0_g1~~TRINITY_DN62117_c0_g1_i1.p1  ORF type:complete len:913 (+),score=129.78 TRINITY_DN62117_c0_g1_i1:22-2760(+)